MMTSLVSERGAVLREMTGVDVADRWKRFRSETSTASAGTAARELLWYATVALWSERFGIGEVRKDALSAMPVV
jgi:hypothetical protein